MSLIQPVKFLLNIPQSSGRTFECHLEDIFECESYLELIPRRAVKIKKNRPAVANRTGIADCD